MVTKLSFCFLGAAHRASIQPELYLCCGAGIEISRYWTCWGTSDIWLAQAQVLLMCFSAPPFPTWLLVVMTWPMTSPPRLILWQSYSREKQACQITQRSMGWFYWAHDVGIPFLNIHTSLSIFLAFLIDYNSGMTDNVFGIDKDESSVALPSLSPSLSLSSTEGEMTTTGLILGRTPLGSACGWLTGVFVLGCVKEHCSFVCMCQFPSLLRGAP